MLHAERSSTTSSRSTTSKGLQTPIQFVKGVGPKLGAVLESRGVRTVKDLLTLFPRAYEDRSKFLKVQDLEEGEHATLSLTIVASRSIPMRGRRKRMLSATARDETGIVQLKWFHSPRGIEQRLQPDTPVVVTGRPKKYRGNYEIVHPELSFAMADGQVAEYQAGRVIPIYTEIEGITSRSFRRMLWGALEAFGPSIKENLPPHLLKKHGLPGLREALTTVHFPAEGAEPEAWVGFRNPAHQRFIYEEFLRFEYLVLKRRLKTKREEGRAFEDVGDARASLEECLPFELTRGQAQALDDILQDMGEPHPMNRLIQGDVGSGKTAVGLVAAGCVLAQGSQVALMAPTEVLAEQHYKNALKFFGDKLRFGLLTGRTPAAERKKILGRLAAGEPMLLMGTHALLEPEVKFHDLGLVIIDEQHRFGVDQRKTLRDKNKLPPHMLIMTATPIPRTLALTAYGDLAVTSIKERPPGRSPVKTKVFFGSGEQAKAYEAIAEQIGEGRQVFFIFPLVNESEAEGFTHLKAATTEVEELRKKFPRCKVGLLHGQLRPDEKAAVMEDFSRGNTHILVSTTVVEVGVDVPNATVIVIEHAERFGLSQLHQLRGRVGRGQHAGSCFLFTGARVAETSQARLSVLEQTEDGFRIAEADLEIRGPGEFMGTRQSGALPFKIANLVRDQDWLMKARDDALELLKDDPDLQSTHHQSLRTSLIEEARRLELS